MSRIDKKAKDFVLAEMKYNGKMQQEDVMKLLDVYCGEIDEQKILEKQKRARANRFMANFKDEDGTRKFFSVKDGTKTTYVDVNTTNEIILIDDVISTLCKQMKGLNKSIKKAKTRKQVLEGQVQIEELQCKAM